VVAITGIALAYIFYIKRPDLPDKLTEGQWGYDIVKNKYLVDELYDETIVKPTVEGSKLLWKQCDARGIDGVVNGVARIIGWFSDRGKAFQSGFVRNYALFIVVGFIALLLIAI
jgi:NADH-quinone oxidoreductase subunit L